MISDNEKKNGTSNLNIKIVNVNDLENPYKNLKQHDYSELPVNVLK